MSTSLQQESLSSDHSQSLVEIQNNNHALISFRAILAGLLIAIFIMIGLTGLGLSIGWLGIENAEQSLGAVRNTWFILSVFVSLTLGSYFASRVSKYRMGRVGSVQGLVISSLFLGLLLFRPVFTSGPLSSVGFVIDSLYSLGNRPGMNEILQSNHYQMFMEDIVTLSEEVIADFDLKSPTDIVAQGVAVRVLNGRDLSARNYLLRESSMTPIDAESQILKVRMEVNKLLIDTQLNAAESLRRIGQMLFSFLILGSLAGILGGGIGSIVNFRKPLVRNDDKILKEFKEQEVKNSQ